jgi:hypothetical protein
MAAAGWQTLTNDLAVLGETPVLKTTPTMSGPKQLPVHDGGDEQAVSVSSPDVASTPDATQLTAARGTLMTTPFAAAPGDARYAGLQERSSLANPPRLRL